MFFAVDLIRRIKMHIKRRRNVLWHTFCKYRSHKRRSRQVDLPALTASLHNGEAERVVAGGQAKHMSF